MRAASGGEPNPTGEMVRAEFAKWLTAEVDSKAETIAAFDRHNERVRGTVPVSSSGRHTVAVTTRRCR